MSQITTLITNLAALNIGTVGTGDDLSAVQESYQIVPRRFVILTSLRGSQGGSERAQVFGTTDVYHRLVWTIADVTLFRALGNAGRGMKDLLPTMATYAGAYGEAMADSTEYGYTSNNPFLRTDWRVDIDPVFEWGGTQYWAVVAIHTVEEQLNP